MIFCKLFFPQLLKPDFVSKIEYIIQHREVNKRTIQYFALILYGIIIYVII